MDESGISNPNQLAKLSGIPQPVVRRIYIGEAKDPRKDTLQRFADFFGVDVDSFRTVKPNIPTQLPTTSSGILIQQYTDVSGSMGDGITLRDQPGQITEWMVTPEWLNKNIPANTGNKNLRIITGFGDSMRGMFNSGDPLIVDIGVTTVEYDAVYFFRVGNEGFIKRLQRVPGRGLMAISENKAYESWAINDDMDFEVFGRVLKAWQSEEF